MGDATYDSKASAYFANQRQEMLPFIPANAKRMLEVGCGTAGFAAHLKSLRPIHVTGIEAFAAAAETARTRIDRVISASIEDAMPQIAGEKFDCIVMNDVLEHLVDPWAVLRQLRGFLAPEGVFVASIPNMRYMPVFKEYVLGASWRYAEFGVLDKTHLRFFTRSTMRELFESSGYSLVSIEGINGIEFTWKFRLLNALMRDALQDTRFIQFACVARANNERA